MEPQVKDCVFCQYSCEDPSLKSKILYIVLYFKYQDDTVVAFNDINPQAEVHILVIPRKHIPNYGYLNLDSKEDYLLAKHMKEVGESLLNKVKPGTEHV